MGNFYFRKPKEIPCAPGLYATGNATVCTPCTAGSICPNTDGTGIETCLPGMYSERNAIVCEVCRSGYACPDTNTSLTIYKCPAGMYSLGSQTECTPCDPG